MANVALRDYGTIPNALNNGTFVPGAATFVVQWSGAMSRGHFSDGRTFDKTFVQTGANITWHGSSGLGTFTSSGVTKVKYAEVAQERNGQFFH
jgi:hypothetical protein